MESLSGKILGATDQASYFLGDLKLNFNPLVVVDILIVTILFYWVYIFLKETRAMRILYGIVFIAALMILGRILNLVLLNWILRSFTTALIVAIPIVFQPELRTALEKLGRTKFLGELAFSKESSASTIENILSAVAKLSTQKIGALIVVRRQTGLRDYIENGVRIYADLTTELLLSIFFPKSPLHDGAVIIEKDKIVSAGSILPVSQQPLSQNFGTRHKAGLGITEDSDAISIIVSEETGNVSIAVAGKLETRISEERLKNRLVGLLRK